MRNTDKLFTGLFDGLLVTSTENVFYLSGFLGTSGWLLLTENGRHLFTDFRYVEQAKHQAAGFTIHEKKDLAALGDVIASAGVKTLGFEDATLSVREYEHFKKLPVTLTPASDAILSLRVIKTPDEIEKIKAAQALTEAAYEHLFKTVRPGMTEREVAFMLEAYVKTHGASRLSFDPIVASGANGAMPHAKPTDRALSPGDLVVIDFGCCLDGYCADMTRTIGIGKVSDFAREVYNTVLSAQTSAVSAAKPGMKASELDKVARDIIDAAGFGDKFGHALGHGVGIEIHESPTASPKSEDVLKPGMLVTIEPGIYLPGRFGVRIEDLVVLTQNGAENCNLLQKELICIE